MGTFDELSQSGVDFSSLLKRGESDECLVADGDDITPLPPPYTPSPKMNMLPPAYPTPSPSYHTHASTSLMYDSNPVDYLSKSLDPSSLLSQRPAATESIANDTTTTDSDAHHSARAPLLLKQSGSVHRSLTHLHHRAGGSSAAKQRPHTSGATSGAKTKSSMSQHSRKSAGVQRLLSEESGGGRVSLTRSMESVTQGVLGSVLSMESLGPDYQVRGRFARYLIG